MNIGNSFFTILELVIIGILLFAFFQQLYHYLRYMLGVLRKIKKNNKETSSSQLMQEGVSVIICARDEAKNLRTYLPTILEQDYPNFEVIVINDGSTDDTDELLEQYCAIYKNLKKTFVPIGANVMCTKKLGLSLGIKASQYNYLLFTDADCRPESKQWIASIMRNFSDKTEIVLGYGAYFQEKSFLNKLINYDTLFTSLRYLGMAYSGKPYMGVGRNMAYTKELFFHNKGFAGTLGLRAGYDELFVNKHATGENTQIEISPESITWSVPKKTFGMWLHQKIRHFYVLPYYNTRSKFRLLIEPIFRTVFYAALVLAFVCGNYLTWAVAGGIFLLRLVVQLCVLNISAHKMRLAKFGPITILLFDILLPIIHLYILTIGKFKSRRLRW